MKICVVTCMTIALVSAASAQGTAQGTTQGTTQGTAQGTSKATHNGTGASAPAADDPCRYLVASEVELYTGPLVAPPFRANSDSATPRRTGDACLYRGKDGRGVFVSYSAAGGKVAGTAARRVPAVLDRTVGGAAGDQDGTEHQGMGASVMGPAGPGPWDNSNWFPTGTIIVYKGDASFDIDISATSAGKDAAIDLATKAIGRLGHPLDYDGAKAVALAPKPVPKVPPCDLIPRARAEAILGTLSAAPVADDKEAICTYTVASSDGDIKYAVAITWGNGYKQLNMLKHGMSNIMGPMTASENTINTGRNGGLPSMAGGMPAAPPLDSSQQKMFGAFTKAVGLPQASGIGKRGTATDSTLAGPWDSAALVNGDWLIATRHDVAVTIAVGNADYDKAKALVTAACERL
jgi:hypothetical protein